MNPAEQPGGPHAAETSPLLKQQCARPGARGAQSGGNPGGTAARDDHIELPGDRHLPGLFMNEIHRTVLLFRNNTAENRFFKEVFRIKTQKRLKECSGYRFRTGPA